MAMDEEVAWRKGLEVRGKDWVMAELQRKRGQPGEVVLDVGFEEPHPTREFCQMWCSEEDNRIFQFPATRSLSSQQLWFLLAHQCWR